MKKTYFLYKGKNVRIARDAGELKDRFTKTEIIDALESGDAIIDNDFIVSTSQNNKIMAVFELP